MTEEIDENFSPTGNIYDKSDDFVRFKTLTIDYSLYEDYRKNSDMSDEEWRETLDALWVIITGFVSLGFNVHPVQQVCEQNRIPEEFLTSQVDDLLSSKESINQKFNEITDGVKPPSQEGSRS